MRGDHWEISYDGGTGKAEDCRGLRYIAILVREGGGDNGPIHARELVARATGQPDVAIELHAKEYILDGAARTQLVRRVEEIGFERTRAEAASDYDRAAALEEEYERIAEELSRGRRRGGSQRASFDNGDEKARKAVSKAITEAIARVAANRDLSPLARHLTGAIRKGQWLSYTGSLDWHVDFSGPLPRK